jgi:pyruvate,water dikinase
MLAVSSDHIILTKLEICKKYFEILENSIAASEIRGQTASPGKIIGTAKIILNQNDFIKMETGDVIIASMTRPEYVPIMKKASAIVTDEGGITCHAAIVSRELNIPCITGTQVATRFLKNSDLIDVNADHSLIKIIKPENIEP